MDSSSSVRTLEPSKIYLPKCWNKFLDRLSKTRDLAEKLVLVNKAKFLLENEAARLATSQLETFSMAMEIVMADELMSFNFHKFFHILMSFLIIKVFEDVLNDQ
ncbi:hypothetical protein L6452_44437 [Arctium lappa]|uniref:Uncharacterized protein n=1 Tax=Arctium lappa TaxID=4217 RepID=A0ACB8XFM1_ARCLA|nr:hypothetical protein L6452_44437 [Arctium lappa]